MPTQGNDIIRISPGESVAGLGGADQFIWTGGNATIDGGDSGEAYDSNVYGDKTGGDRLFIENVGAVKLVFASTEDGVATSGRDALAFSGIERIHLGAGDDIVRAGAATMDRYPLSVWTGAGNDQVNGSRGGDFIDPGEGNDTVWAGAGDDFIQGSRGDDLIYGGAGGDNIRWGQGTGDGNTGAAGLAYGNDTVFGGAGSDVVNLWAYDWDGTGVSVSIGKVFADGAMRGTGSLSFTGTRETITFHGMEQVWAHEGRDTLDASGAQVVGDLGVRVNLRWNNDTLIGSRGNDTLEGGDGADTITGGAGNDLLVGGGNYWNAGAGQDGSADLFVFRAGHGQDTIQGFEMGLDRLALGGRDYAAVESGSGTLLTFGGGDSILLHGQFDFI